MTSQSKFIIIGMLIVLPLRLLSQPLPEKINSYTYIKISGKSKDSIKVKDGYWEERSYISDTEVTYWHTFDGPSDKPNNGLAGKKIALDSVNAKGNYSANMKNGKWQYFDWDTKLYKEVDFKSGIIESVKYYNDDRSLHLMATYKPNQRSFHFEKYNKKGEKILEGDFPAEFIYSGMDYLGLELRPN